VRTTSRDRLGGNDAYQANLARPHARRISLGLPVCLAQGERAVAALREQGDVVDGRMNPWNIVLDKSVRAATALSARLRLAPQSRYERAKQPRRLTWMDRHAMRQEANDYE
jgi:hypothetical protein